MNEQSKQSTAVAKEPTKATSIRYQRPHYWVDEMDSGFKVEAYMPGVTRDSVDISVEKGELVVIGRRDAATPGEWKVLHRESSPLAYRLGLTLGDQINHEKIEAELVDGVLTIMLAKAEEAKPLRIKVK